MNGFSAIFNCYGKVLPTVATVSLYTTLISFVVILITVPAEAPTHRGAHFVFNTFLNKTGWSQNGIAFIVGLIVCSPPSVFALRVLTDFTEEYELGLQLSRHSGPSCRRGASA